jgi:hypothetical protein
MSDPNVQSNIKTFSTNPNTSMIPGTFGQIGINIKDGSMWRFVGGATPWENTIRAASAGFTSSFSVAWEAAALAAGAGPTATHYMHIGDSGVVRGMGVVVNGATINSGAAVLVSFNRIRAGVSTPIGAVALVNSLPAGQGNTAAAAVPIAVISGDVIQAVTLPLATVGAGSGTPSIVITNT